MDLSGELVRVDLYYAIRIEQGFIPLIKDVRPVCSS
jgi:hypothetical protein